MPDVREEMPNVCAGQTSSGQWLRRCDCRCREKATWLRRAWYRHGLREMIRWRSSMELGPFGALATGRQLAATLGFGRTNMLEVLKTLRLGSAVTPRDSISRSIRRVDTPSR